MRRGEGMSIAQALAMTVAEIPVFLYSTFGQVNPFIHMHTQSVRYVWSYPHCFFCFQSIFSQLRLTPSLKKVLFATALGSVALALTAHQLKRRGRKRKQGTQEKDGQKTVGIPESLMKTGRPSSLKRGVKTEYYVSSFCCCYGLFSVFQQWLLWNIQWGNVFLLGQPRLLVDRWWVPALEAMIRWVEFPPWLPVNTQVHHTAWHL